jgi:hypothetical protein
MAMSLDRFKDLVENVASKLETPCIFISHVREDTEACEPIAQYIQDAGLDVYFDKYDQTLADLVRQGNPDKVTERIQSGIDHSTHMICVVSPRTVTSYWVPFEVGYGCKSAIGLGVLTLKGIADDDLPDYMKTTRVIRGTRSLNEFIAELVGTSTDRLVEQKAIKKHTDGRHPLDKVLDWGK